MGIRLDWQVEAERVYERSGEDPNFRNRRRRRRFQFLLIVLGLALGLSGIAAIIVWRLNTVDSVLRQSLTDAVQAEVAALRVGDYTGFITLQRSASPDWIRYQNIRFDIYQQMKANNQVELLGNVLDATVDGQRGRALIEERRNGQRHVVVWFYWRYPDGWRHVPSDYTFWGELDEIERKQVTVQYNTLDASLATAIADRVETWWTNGCLTLGCTNIPHLNIEIVPVPGLEITWDTTAETDDLLLLIASPLANEDGTTVENGMPQTMEDALAVKIAERQFGLATNDLLPIPTADAAWLRQATVEWLAATFTGRIDPVYFSFMQGLTTTYGTNSVGQLVQALTPTADISVLGAALGQPLAGLALDWRSFFQWRLDLEKTLLTEGRIDEFRAIWDVGNPQAQSFFQQRLQDPTQQTPQVESAAIVNGPDGVPTATIQAQLAGQPVYISFRLVDGTWKRAA